MFLAQKLARKSLCELFGVAPKRVTGLWVESQEPVPYLVHPKLAAARELMNRVFAEQFDLDVLANPDAVKKFLITLLAGREKESFIGIFLDSQSRVISVDELFTGTLTSAAVYPREVVKRVLEINANSVIFAHNHPSGVADPSTADLRITNQLKQSLGLFDVRVLDHLIVADNKIVSLAETGQI